MSQGLTVVKSQIENQLSRKNSFSDVNRKAFDTLQSLTEKEQFKNQTVLRTRTRSGKLHCCNMVRHLWIGNGNVIENSLTAQHLPYLNVVERGHAIK